MGNRPERVASLIKEEIGAILAREYSGQLKGLTTVTDVKLSPDLRNAKVFVSVYGPADVRRSTMEFLGDETPHIRGMIGSRIRIRFTPELRFVLDETLDRVDRINQLIKQIHEERKGQGDGG